MLDSKFMLTLIGLIVGVIAISNTNFKSDTKENWWGNPQMTTKVMTEVYPKGIKNGRGYNLPDHISKKHFASYPNFKPVMSPRFGNMQLPADIRYNPPSLEYQGVPKNPLDFGDMATENYEEPGVRKCGKWGKEVDGTRVENNRSGFQDDNYTDSVNKIYKEGGPDSTSLTPTTLLPVGDMNSIQADGTNAQTQIYERHIFAQLRGRNTGQACNIRGDLAIAPQANNGWFNVSANPVTDLKQGALSIINGRYNETSNALAELIHEASGDKTNIIGGFDYGESLGQENNNKFTTNLDSNLYK